LRGGLPTRGPLAEATVTAAGAGVPHALVRVQRRIAEVQTLFAVLRVIGTPRPNDGT